MPTVIPFTDEQSRQLVNLRARYEVWMEAERDIEALPYDLRKKRVGDHDYLYEIFDREGNGKSLGPVTPELERRFSDYREEKKALKERRKASWSAVEESCRLGRSLRLPMLSSEAGALLREADKRMMLGNKIMVVGTNAIPAYSIEAAGQISNALNETDDFDLAWVEPNVAQGTQPLWAMLKAVDATFTVNSERKFQARNAKAYEVEVLVAPSRKAGMFRTDQPRPVSLAEQEWLLNGRMVDQVVVCRDATPARIVAPDPRWFALQKLWLAMQSKRNPLKRRKDERQGTALLDAIVEAMPQFPIDEAFAASLPPDLRPIFDRWEQRRRMSD